MIGYGTILQKAEHKADIEAQREWVNDYNPVQGTYVFKCGCKGQDKISVASLIPD